MQVSLTKQASMSSRVPFSAVTLLLLLFVLSGCATQQEMESTAAAEPAAVAPAAVAPAQNAATVNALEQLSDEQIKTAIKNAYNKYKNDQSGKNADYIKALADVDSKLFGISVVMADGRTFDIGDTGSKFSIQSISKVFTYAKIMQENGPEVVKEKIGVNATGLPFNSIHAIELNEVKTVNPFVNAGAIASTSLVKAKDSEQRWNIIKSNMDAFAGHKLDFNEVVYDSEVNDNLRNQAISKILDASGFMYSDPLEATTVYTKQCSVNVTSHDLAVMGSVLANNGVNPVTQKKSSMQPIPRISCRSWQLQGCMTMPANGSMRQVRRPRAVSVAASSPSCRAKWGSVSSLHRWINTVIASEVSWRRPLLLINWV